jgi:hypothetical protein
LAPSGVTDVTRLLLFSLSAVMADEADDSAPFGSKDLRSHFSNVSARHCSRADTTSLIFEHAMLKTK